MKIKNDMQRQEVLSKYIADVELSLLKAQFNDM